MNNYFDETTEYDYLYSAPQEEDFLTETDPVENNGNEYQGDYWESFSKRQRSRKRKSAVVKASVIAASLIAVIALGALIAGKTGNVQNSIPIQTVPIQDSSPAYEYQQPSPTTDYEMPQADSPDTSPVSASDSSYFRYFRSGLNPQEQAIYDELLSGLADKIPTVRVNTTDFDMLEKIWGYLSADNPECFWIGKEFKTRSFESDTEAYSDFTFVFPYSADEAAAREEQINAVVDPIVRSLSGKSDYEKVKAVYEYLIESTVYDLTDNDQSCYSVLVEGRGVCAGYASAMQLILNRLGVDTILADGFGDGEPHAWNLVKIDGKWYQIDATWGDPVSNDGKQRITYDYFLLTDGEMLKDHTYGPGKQYPVCNSSCAEKENDFLEVRETGGVRNTYLSVHFIDVGQADASLIICDGEAMMIDGGNADDSQLIYSYLKKNGVKNLRYVICTHPHEDHAGGLSGALNLCTADNVFCTMTDYDTAAFKSFKKYAEKRAKKITVPNAGEKYILGSSEFTILAPGNAGLISDNTSIIVRLVYGEKAFLFMGDAEYEDEQILLNSGYEIKCDVLKVGHHGSSTSTGYQFLYETEPDYAVISVGEDNPYGHPDDAVISRLNDADVETFRTDYDGTVICYCDGNTINFEREKSK